MSQNYDAADSAILRKIKKLLALAKGGGPQGEVEAATAKVQQLLLEHNLDMASVEHHTDEERERDEPIISAESPRRRQVSLEDKFLYKLFTNPQNFQVHVLLSRSSFFKTTATTFVGRRSNVMVAAYLFEFLRDEFKRLFANYQWITGCKASHRPSFYLGLASGLQHQLDTQRAAFERAAAATPSGCQALARIDKDQSAIAQHIHKEHNVQGKYRGTIKGETHLATTLAGHQMGKKINLHTPLPNKQEGKEP